MTTKIEWCDETLNPQGWGCYGPGGTPDNPQRCSYCYAYRMASRMLRTCELCNQFIPHYHPEAMAKVRQWKKPRKIFWQSMGDLFHPHTPDWLIQEVLYTVKIDLRHTHIFLTKNPRRLLDFNSWPSNCWVGTTVTNQQDADERLPWLLKVEAPVRFVSHEPLLGEIDLYSVPKGYFKIPQGQSKGPLFGIRRCLPKINWAIIGAMTGPGAVKPDPGWGRRLIDQYRAAGVPVFCKDNLEMPVGMRRIQEWPHE